MRIQGFAPIINKECRILILGSMPGIESLRIQEYYGHPQNKFWDVLYGIYNKTPNTEYSLKKQFLLNHHIAVWDVIESCKRKGSSDSAIRSAKLNDFTSLFRDFPGIRHVYFNGRTSEKLFISNFGFPELQQTYLGSTSPAHAIPMETRLLDWSKLLNGNHKISPLS